MRLIHTRNTHFSLSLITVFPHIFKDASLNFQVPPRAGMNDTLSPQTVALDTNTIHA